MKNIFLVYYKVKYGYYSNFLRVKFGKDFWG